MILKGNQRSGARQLALHLLNERDNDHVEIHKVEGFVASDVAGALTEIYAMSRATRCRQFLFSLSLSPPQNEIVPVADFEAAIQLAAEKLGLSGQPHVILFHEKEGRRHAHAVFSRIDPDEVKAINLPFYKQRLTELSRELYLTHGWDLPKGLSDPSLADPANFGLTEWQEAKRAKRDAREIKMALKACWTQSDGAASFASALRERGFWLARGNRRGFIALDYQGNSYSLSRWLDVKSKALNARLGLPDHQPTADEVCASVDKIVDDVKKRVIAELKQQQAAIIKPLMDQRRRMVAGQRLERHELALRQRQQWEAVQLANALRFRTGLKGMWDWLTGRRRETLRSIDAEIERVRRQDEAARELQRQRHLTESRAFQMHLVRLRQIHASWIADANMWKTKSPTLHRDESLGTTIRSQGEFQNHRASIDHDLDIS